jgi:aminoglycoside phosphotransferase (APT) family kinase protein
LEPVVRASVGGGLAAVERVAGGSKKGVYRLTLTRGGTVVLYVWSAGENYWPARDRPEDVFADASGLDLFRAAHDQLVAVGVRTPRLLWADDTREVFPADVAVVEDVRGGTLEDRLACDPASATLGRLRSALAAMAAIRDPRLGKVGRPDRSGRTCAEVVLDGARRDLVEAADRVPSLAAQRAPLGDRLDALAAAVRPRPAQALVHGELGPDHVLLDDAAQPVLVDIEGLAFFDSEWEHAFLEMRFGPAYPALRLPGLDEARLRFYRLARHLSLVAGPLRLLDGDFPDRAFMLEIAEWHTGRALSYLG